MDRIQQCVKDVLHIANNSGDFDEAKKRIEQLFVQAEHRQHVAVVQKVRDHLHRARDDATADGQDCLDRLLDWLDRECLPQHRNAG